MKITENIEKVVVLYNLVEKKLKIVSWWEGWRCGTVEVGQVTTGREE